MTNISSYAFILVIILLGASLASATLLQERDALRTFLQSRANTLGKGPVKADTYVEADTWADPDSSFKHLPTHCPSSPPGAKEADKIVALPGQPPRVNFDQYSGYITVSEEHGRALFYYFVEAPYEASSKPLVLWLNGGPWCSSLGAGAFQELGPFRVNPDGKTLSRNRHAWNNLANVIFLESPAGVGFSYSNTSSENSVSGDTRTSVDAYIFLLHWLERFPEYKGRDFFIAGESYSGHYAPQLATVILALHKLGATSMNLKGIFVGNPLLDDYKNTRGMFEYLWNHGDMSDEVWGEITDLCKFGPSESAACNESMASVNTGYDPCIDYHVFDYFNNPEVQKAIHARANTKWIQCKDLPWTDAPVSMMPTIDWLVDNGLRVWLYRTYHPALTIRGILPELNVIIISTKEELRKRAFHNEACGQTVLILHRRGLSSII
ncbi:hypothetical protein QYE76_005791 [Lolium multiflorum]|uniref:Carboxypeptidase n=1 Tax=Lolium multiflorum TaxID=4521 RepID=A0AAD8RTE4_LOLMU|nr:hypothetical protein QYE76_005791 [Lolium multiflorum]